MTMIEEIKRRILLKEQAITITRAEINTLLEMQWLLEKDEERVKES